MKNSLLLLLLTTFLLPATTFGEEQGEILISWDFEALTNQRISGFTLYLDGIPVCKTNAPAERARKCQVSIDNSPMYFTMTAQDSAGNESPFSDIFGWSRPNQ